MTGGKNILVVDDEQMIREALTSYLEKQGCHVFQAETGREALQVFQRESISFVILDLMLPGMDGYQVCREIREKSDVPVIIITARGEDFERIMGLDIGADDYIVKPFSPSEVMARIRAILRRMSRQDTEESKGVLSVSTVTINIEEYTLHISGTNIPLTKKEIETMWVLAGNPNKVFTRDNLLDSLWGIDYFGDSRTVDSHIKRLRAKLDKVPHPEWRIKTIWGLGYKFEIEEQEKN